MSWSCSMHASLNVCKRLAGRPTTTSRRPSKPLRRVNPDPGSDGGEGGEEGSGASSEEDPNAPPGEAGRKRSRSGRGTPKRKRRHRLAVVKGGWNEEDDAKLTRSESAILLDVLHACLVQPGGASLVIFLVKSGGQRFILVGPS